MDDSTPKAGLAVPPPSQLSNITLVKLGAERLWHRIHPDKYGATQFNDSAVGNARFSPLVRPDGIVIPTIYAATNFECAAMETVFHDVPYAPGFKPLAVEKLDNKLHSTFNSESELTLVDLRGLALRKLGVQRNQLIDTEKNQYPVTRQWAHALHDQCPDAQGLLWVSRQHDEELAIVLFGDRVPPGSLFSVGHGMSLRDEPDTWGRIILLAQGIGVSIVTSH